MTFDEYVQPQPVVSDRKPWDQVLTEFAARTGRPLWPVERYRYQGRHAHRSDDMAAHAPPETSTIDGMLTELRARKTDGMLR